MLLFKNKIKVLISEITTHILVQLNDANKQNKYIYIHLNFLNVHRRGKTYLRGMQTTNA